jgi:hypothetical protein|eukprot:SAG25_NODE_536_length_7104_cov_4.295789_8_plen_36_part_00
MVSLFGEDAFEDDLFGSDDEQLAKTTRAAVAFLEE